MVTTATSNSTPMYIPKRNEHLWPDEICAQMFISVLFITASKWKEHTYPSVDKV